MTLTVLALVFLIFILIIAILGQRLLSQKTDSVKNTSIEHCSICRNAFDKRELIERQIADVKLMYFCSTCIEQLHKDLRVIQKRPVRS